VKFAFIVTNLAGGGAEKALLTLGSQLARRGHEVHLVLLEHHVDHPPPAEIRIHALTQRGRRLLKGALGKPIAVLRLRRLISALAQPRPFDLIVSTLPFADEVAVRASLPRHWCRIANTLSAEIARLRARDPGKARRRLRRYRRLYGRGSLIAVSDGVAEDLRRGLGLDHPRIERIYNPFDFAAMRTLAAETAPDRPAVPYLIHVGRFTGQKRHDLLLDAFALLDIPHPLVLLTEREPALSDMIRRRGLDGRVVVAGFRTNPYPWIAGAKLLVLSSDHEGLPNVIIEALALDTPVVSTDCPSGPREILGGTRPGCLVPVNDAAGLAQAIARVLADPPLSRVDLNAYAADTVVAAYEALAAERPSARGTT
jgi:glycosyltransferase involved in cell wall biosynthesis